MEGEGCGDQESPLICTEFYVFKPLPVNCEGEDGCLEVTSGVQEACISEAEIDRTLDGGPEAVETPEFKVSTKIRCSFEKLSAE